MENQDIIRIEQTETLQAINKAEIDVQIATAKAYPRDINKVLNQLVTYATMDRETAEECFYVLRRKGPDGRDTVIEGLSVRMAEVIMGAWGNLRVQARVIANDGRMITAQAVCHDLETNLAVSKEVSRRITNKYGKTFSEDMQVVTGNAACSIALRNAVLAVVPKAVTKNAMEQIRKVALGKSIDLETSRQNVMSYFRQLGVTDEQLFFYLGIGGVAEIDREKVYTLRATANAIKEGTTTVEEAFVLPFKEEQARKLEQEKSETAANKAAQAMRRAMNGTEVAEAAETPEAPPQFALAPEDVDPVTGEIREKAERKPRTTATETQI